MSMALDSLRVRLKAEVEMRIDALVGGAAEDHADYRYRVGVLDGIALVLREMADIEAELNDD